MGMLNHSVDDPAFPRVTCRRGAAGQPTPVLRGTGIRVQTVVIATRVWGMTREQVIAEYDLTPAQINAALGFYEAHRAEIDAVIAAEQEAGY